MRESWGSTKPTGAMKVKARRSVGPGRIPVLGAGRTTGPSRLAARPSRVGVGWERRSKSAHVGTRKMVNYA